MKEVYLDIRGVVILENICLEVRPGIHCLLGPNGSGKTMTNRLLGMLQEVSSGRIVWDDVIINPIDSDKQQQFIRKIGYMNQEPVFVNRSVWDNIALPLQFRQLNDDVIDNRVTESLNNFDLIELASKNIYELSTGQRQKVALARTLIIQPEVLLLDEPSSSLDMATTKWFEQTILDLQKAHGLITVWTTHDQFQVRRIADFVSVIIGGNLLESGSIEDVLDNSSSETVKKYLKGELVGLE